MLPEKGVSLAVVWTVRRWCLDCGAELEESSTSEIQPDCQSESLTKIKVMLMHWVY